MPFLDLKRGPLGCPRPIFPWLARRQALLHTPNYRLMKIIVIVAVVLLILFVMAGRASRRGDTTSNREGADGGPGPTDSHGHNGDSGGDGGGDGGGD